MEISFTLVNGLTTYRPLYSRSVCLGFFFEKGYTNCKQINVGHTLDGLFCFDLSTFLNSTHTFTINKQWEWRRPKSPIRWQIGVVEGCPLNGWFTTPPLNPWHPSPVNKPRPSPRHNPPARARTLAYLPPQWTHVSRRNTEKSLLSKGCLRYAPWHPRIPEFSPIEWMHNVFPTWLWIKWVV